MYAGSVVYELELSTDKFNQAWKSMEQQMRSIKSIVPKVNHEPLNQLNEHLTIKERHIDKLNQKKIEPSVDTQGLEELTKSLESIQDILSDSLSFEIDISSAESSLDSMAQAAEESLQQNLETFKQNTANFAKFATAPFESVFTGIFEGIGNVISKKIGKGLESSLKKSTNISLEGIGGFLGDITSEVLSQIDETAGLSLNVRNVQSADEKQKNTKKISNTEPSDGIKPKKLSKSEQSDAISKSVQEVAQAINEITGNAVKFAKAIKDIELIASLVPSALSNVANDTQPFMPDLANIKNIPRPEPVPVLVERNPSLKSKVLNAGKIASEQSLVAPKVASQNAPRLEIAGNYKDLEQNTDAFVEEIMSHARYQLKMYQEVAKILNKTGDKRERLKSLINKAERGKRELNPKELAEALEIIKEIRGKAEFVLNDDIARRAEGRIDELGQKLPEKDKKFGTEFQRIKADIANRKTIAQKAISATESFISSPKTGVEKQIFKAISSGQASQNWDKTTASIKENIKEIAEESQKNSKKIQGGISEASPGPTSNARKNWKNTSDYIKEQIKSIVEDARSAAKQLDGSFASPDQKRQLRLERVIESKLKRGETVPDSVLEELKGIFTRPAFVSRENITEDRLKDIQRATIIAIRKFGANSNRAIQLLDKLESAREIVAKQESDKANRIPKTWQEINQQAELTKKRKEQEKKRQQEIERGVQEEVAELNKLASSLATARSPERIAELERKRQEIRDRYEQKRAKEFQDWLKTQKDIGINRNTDFGRQSRINELRSSIDRRTSSTNQAIQKEVDSLDRISQPFAGRDITEDYLIKIQRATTIAIRKFGANSNRAIQLLDKLESAREIVAKQESDKANRIPKTQQEIDQQAELTKKRKEQEKKRQQEIERGVQEEVAELNKLASSLATARSPERLAELEKKRQAIREKYEQKRAREFQEWLKTQKDIGINRNTDSGRQSRINELRSSIDRRTSSTNQAIQKEVDSLDRISQPFAGRDITEDYLIKIQRATTIAIRKFGANSNRAIQLLDKLESARGIVAKQEADKANRIPKTQQEINQQAELTKKRKEQEKKRQQEIERGVQEEVAELNKLASSLATARSPERIAELERKRQEIRDRYEQKRAKEFQDWLKTQKDIGINRNTDFGRQSRINELRSSIDRRTSSTNQAIQKEVDSLDRISQPFAGRDITEDYLIKIQRATTIAIRKFGANSNRAIQLLDKLESARGIVAKQEADKANRIPKTQQEIDQQAELTKKRKEQEAKLRQETEAQIKKEIADLNKLADSISQSKTPERLAELEKKRQAIREKYEQKRAKEFQDWLKTQKDIGVVKPSSLFSQPKDEARKARLEEKINRLQKNNLPVPSTLTDELNRINDGLRIGSSKAKQQTLDSQENQNRINELRKKIERRRNDIAKAIKDEVDGLNRISQSFGGRDITEDYLNKLQQGTIIAIRKFGANSNRAIQLLDRLESARKIFAKQEADKANRVPKTWQEINEQAELTKKRKEQEKQRQQEIERGVQEEIEALRRLGRPDPKVMANIEARRKAILDRRAVREKEARERAELARLKQERQEETSLQGFLDRPLRALNRVRRSTFADAKIETLAQKYADFGTESYFDKFFRSMSNRIKRKISKDPNERETVAREGFGMLFGMTAMSNPLLPALASLAPLAVPLLPAALAVSGGINMVAPAFQGASQRIQGVENFNARLNAVTGDPVKSGAEYEYLLGLAEKYRVSLQSLSEGYTQLAVATRGTKLEGEPTKELFSAITASIKAMRLNTFDASLVLNAYTQIVAKGKISMEELRQQLGEKFPPTMSVFAKALGVSQAELGQLVAKGSLLSDEVLPKVTKVLEQEFGSAAEKGTSDFTSALASMETALFKLDRNFTDIFGGMFAGITNLASGIVTAFSDNFRIISQLAGAFTIGVVAQVGIGLSTILAMPKIAPFVSSIQGFIMGAWKTGLITLTPFMSGILADVIDDVFNTENDLFTNMAKGTTNIFAASIGSLENISYGISGKGFFGYNWEKAVNPIQSIGNTLSNLFKSIPSGVFELAALTFMFEQLIVLGQMFLMPLLGKLWLTFKGMGGAIWTAATNAKSLGGVFDTLFASSAMAKGALVALNIALKAFVALGFMAFARSDFTNPLQSSLNESEQKIGASIDNIQNLLNKLEAPTLEVKVKGGDELPSKGLELNLMAMLGDESSSYKTDDVIKEGKGFIPVDNPLIRFHAEHLAKQEVPVKQQEAKRLGLEKYLNDYNGFFTLAQDQLLNNAKDLERVNQEVSKALTKQSLMPETVGKSINLLNPFANEAKIIDASIQRLQKERTTAGLTNTSESKVRIREIDKEIKRLNDLRKEKIKPLDEFMTDFESLRKGLNSRIEAVDKQDLPEGAKKALKAIVEGNQKIVEETRKALEEAGFYDILTPLESAWQKATDELKDFEVQYEKTMRRIENKSLNDQTAIYRSELNPVQVSEQVRAVETQAQKDQIKQFEANLIKQQQTLEQYLSVPEGGRTQDQVDAIEGTRKAVFEAEKELASARLSLARSEYETTQDRLRKQQAETKLRVDTEINKKRIEVIRNNPFGGTRASFANAQIDVEERTQEIALLYQQLADNTGNPIEIKSQILSAELALEQARANLLQQQRSLEDYYRNLDRQIVDFNRQIEDYKRQVEDAQLSALREDRSLVESYGDLVRELDSSLLDIQNQILDTSDRIRSQQLKNELLIPGTGDFGRELGDILLEYVQGQADLASRGRTFESKKDEIEQSYIATLRRIRDLEEQQEQAEKTRLRTIEDIKRTQENLNRTLADLIRQTNRELGFIPDSIKAIVANLNVLPDPIKSINSELTTISPNIKTSGSSLVKSIEETAEAIRKAKEGLILPAPSNLIPAPVWNGGGFLPPPPSQSPSQSPSIPKGLTRRGQELSQHLDNPYVKAFLDTIAYAEGTANMPNKGYNTLFGYGQFNSFTDHPRQRIPFGSTSSSASGRYQIMDFTWDEEKSKLGLKDFSPVSQDLVALSRILMRGGLDELLKGDIRGAINATRKEWASFPGANYPGQGMKRMEDLLNFYQQSLRKYQPNASRTQAELDALRYDGNPANSGAVNRVQQIRRNQVGQGANVPSQSPVVPSAFAIPKQIQSVLVQEVGGKTVFSKNANTPPASPASTIKLIVADILSKEIKKGTIGLKDQITIKQPLVDPHGTLKSGNRRTVQELIDLMLRVSDNTATNVLIDLMGGLQSVTNKAQQSGYTATTLSRYLNIPGSGPANRSNAVDTTRAMQAILSDNSEAGQLAEKSIRQTRNFKFSGELGGKIGNNSKVIGNVGIVVINGKEYIVTAYANVDGNILSNRSIITNTTNIIKDTLERKGRGGPEFSSPPPIAQIPTLPEHRFFWEPDLPPVRKDNPDNFWDADLPPVPKDNLINFQSPNLPPVPSLNMEPPKAGAEAIKNASETQQDLEQIYQQLENDFNQLQTLDRLLKFDRQIGEDTRNQNRSIRDAVESTSELTTNAKGYLTVQEQIQQASKEISNQYRSQIESLEDQKRTLEMQVDSAKKYAKVYQNFINNNPNLNPEVRDVLQKNIDTLNQSAENATVNLEKLNNEINRLQENQGVASSVASTTQAIELANEALSEYTSLMADLADRRETTDTLASLFGGGGSSIRMIADYRQKAIELEKDIERGLFTPDQASQMRSGLQEMADIDYRRAFVDANPALSAFRDLIKEAIVNFDNLGQTASNILENIASKLLDNGLNILLGNLFGGGGEGGIGNIFSGSSGGGGIGNIFSGSSGGGGGIGNIFSGLFGGGGVGNIFSGLFGGGASSAFGGLSNFAMGASSVFTPLTSFTLPISLFKDGGTVKDKIPSSFSIPVFKDGGTVSENQKQIDSLLTLGQSVAEAMRLEGSGAIPIVAHEGEELVSDKNGDAEFYRRLKKSGTLDRLKRHNTIENYKDGGTVGESKVTDNQSKSSNKNSGQKTVNNHYSFNYTIKANDPDSFRKSKHQIDIDDRRRLNRR